MSCVFRKRKGVVLIGATIVFLLSASVWERALTAATLYVAVTNSAPESPYSSWDTAAANIQEAIDAAVAGDLVVVGAGIYNTGSRTGDTRLWIDKSVVIVGASGPLATIIEGYQLPGMTNGDGAVRCVYLSAGATLSGFTLRGGATLADNSAGGGGAYCESGSVITNCIIMGNSAHGFGGGVYGGLVRNSVITGNSVGLTGSFLGFGGGAYASRLEQCSLRENISRWGGGAMDSFLTNCVVYRNAALNGGGLNACVAESCTIVSNSAAFSVGGHWMVSEYPSSRNCIVYYNSAPSQPNCGGVTENISYSCTDGVTGQQNIAGEPMFVDLESGNLRLRENSPCIGAGDPLTESVTRDRDNRPRNPAGQTDIGAYGYFGANIGEFIGWLEISGLPTDGSGDTSDSDFDGSDNYEEWRSGTSPSNAEDVLKMLPPQLSTRGISIEWRSVAGKSYALMEIHLSATSGLPRETHIATNVVATGNITSYLVAVGTNGSAQAFRVKVE